MILPRHAPSAADVARHYDGLDAFYRDLWGDALHHGWWETGRETPEQAVEAMTRRVVEAAGAAPGVAVVDVGCGYGAVSRALAARGAAVTGLTLSAAQAEVAQAQPVPEGSVAPTILVRDWLANGLPDAAFDVAVAVESTTHMPDRSRVFSEIVRVLRPGGRLVLCVWLAGDRPGRWAVRHLLEPICREGRLTGLATLAENRAWIEAAGLIIERAEDARQRVARTWAVVVCRVAGRALTDPALRRALLDPAVADRGFAVTVVRLAVALRTGAMGYGVVVARKAG